MYLRNNEYSRMNDNCLVKNVYSKQIGILRPNKPHAFMSGIIGVTDFDQQTQLSDKNQKAKSDE